MNNLDASAQINKKGFAHTNNLKKIKLKQFKLQEIKILIKV